MKYCNFLKDGSYETSILTHCMVHSPLYRKKSIIELLLSHAAIQINYPTIDPRLLLLYIVCLWSMTSTAVGFFYGPMSKFLWQSRYLNIRLNCLSFGF